MNQQNSRCSIVVIGANGGTGLQLVKMALQRNHDVTAIVRNPARLKMHHPNLTIVQGDILQPETYRVSLVNKNVVISAIGTRSTAATTLYSRGSENILKSMQDTGVTRAFFISASGLEVNPSFNFLMRMATKHLLQRILRNMYDDLERMEAIVKRSDLDWTIMRPPRLTNAEVTGRYRFSVNRYLDHGMVISRADLSHFILENIYNSDIYQSTVEVAY
ncbi:SDR family oxidoreductase [Fulvivirgaceae bacterium PWU4]|uniref:SDR family oxidoreductase n=1 Tax=Chryseosolibacter histidini TaxID=2782349 RepID=A0AAP2DRS2_9BACT|nr:SDR family oxidoreductase [Chryseosolibacter histidini]MBT1700123.1 SDR family oxidoreductase [Chryseosolibacter histidini]